MLAEADGLAAAEDANGELADGDDDADDDEDDDEDDPVPDVDPADVELAADPDVGGELAARVAEVFAVRLEACAVAPR